MKNKIFKNKKNGTLYAVLFKGIDCTNERDGTPVIVYTDNKNGVFVREEQEFLTKFEEFHYKKVK